MVGSIRTETETVIKKILPYLARRGYDALADLDYETAAKTTERYSNGYVDILVTCGKTKPQFLLEAKRSSKRLNAKDRDQALAYGRSLKVPFVVVTNGENVQSFNTANGKPIRWNGKLAERIPTKDELPGVILALKADKEVVDVPLGGDESLPFRPGLALKQLNALFTRCHNAIRKIEKDEEYAFADFSKLLFLKLLEEKADLTTFRLPYSYRFHELAEKPESESDQIKDAILQMIAAIKKKTPYGDVLEDEIHLNKPKTFRYIVEELSSVSFHDSNLDTKGAAFEYFVRATLKGKKLGQYFTPRPLVEVMATLVGRERIVNSLLAGTNVRVLDPACGTGGFLVFLMKESLSILEGCYRARKISRKAFDELSDKLMRAVFFGCDANEGVACAAKMNMIIAGDGHTNIRAEDSLASDAKSWSFATPNADFILTNPPFGTSETESLSSADLAKYPVYGTKGQHLFLQRMVLATVAGGEICTVIDEGLLNTETAADLRRWLFQKCEVLAVVGLPNETFKPNKINVKASLLHLRRRQSDDVDLAASVPVTFCDLESLGYAGSGEAIRGFDFRKLLGELESRLLNHSEGVRRNGYHWTAFEILSNEITADTTTRLDVKYWQPNIRERIALLNRKGAKTIGQLNKLETSRGKSPSAELYVDEPDGYALVVKAGTNISKFGELLTDGDYIEKNVFEESPNECMIRRDDVLLASTGDGTLGKSCVFNSDLPAIADGHVTIIRVDSTEIDPVYLADYLRAGFGALQIERLFTGSTGLVELTPEQVKSVIVDPLGSIEEQRRVSRGLRDIEDRYRASIAAAQASLESARDQMAAL